MELSLAVWWVVQDSETEAVGTVPGDNTAQEFVALGFHRVHNFPCPRLAIISYT
jgi:hypothetical protein